MWMLEQSFHGVSQAQMADTLGISTKTVKREMARAMDRPWAEELRAKLRSVADKATGVHEEIITANPAQLQELARAYKLKLDAANALFNGLGGFKSESHTTKETLSLHAVANELTQPSLPPERPRVAFQPETVDGEVVESE